MIAVAIAMAMLQGCGGRAHAAPKLRPDQVSTTVAAARYLALADEANAEVAEAKQQLAGDSADLAGTEDALRTIDRAKRAFDVQLTTLSFPVRVQPDVAALLRSDDQLERRLDAGVQAGTVEELETVTPGIVEAGGAALRAADAVRLALGLPTLG